MGRIHFNRISANLTEREFLKKCQFNFNELILIHGTAYTLWVVSLFYLQKNC